MQRAGPARPVASATACHGVRVVGLDVDAQTRCAHYHSPLDVVALKFRCCGIWYPCIECHRALADHEPQVWSLAERSAQAVLCGVCGLSMSIAAYLASGNSCPRCRAAFNPGCATHYHLYFEMPSSTFGPNEFADG